MPIYSNKSSAPAMEIAAELDADGKQLRVVKLTYYTAEKVRKLYVSPDKLRTRWLDAGQRADSLKKKQAAMFNTPARKPAQSWTICWKNTPVTANFNSRYPTC